MTRPGHTLNIEQVLDREAIRDILLRYARGVDWRDYDAVRSCYHPYSYDDHGPTLRGDLDTFIALIRRGLPRWE